MTKVTVNPNDILLLVNPHHTIYRRCIAAKLYIVVGRRWPTVAYRPSNDKFLQTAAVWQ